jgi:uncharacterized membrane protein
MTAAGLGLISGLRTFQGLAWVAREVSRNGTSPDAPAAERWLSSPLVAAGLGMVASGEVLIDKVPGIPDRVRPGSLFGRAVAGAAIGAVAAGRERQLLGAAVGAGGAVAGAYAGWFLRREAGRVTFLPDIAVAVIEDALAVTLARRLASAR